MNIVPLTHYHIDGIKAQSAQDYFASWITPAIKNSLVHELSFAAVEGARVLGIGGIIEYWPGRALVWAVLADGISKQFVGIHKAVLRFLGTQDYDRIEASADVGFGPGHRWLGKLSFRCETPLMKKYLPNGADASMYVKLKGE